jgi:hypothetical protein
MAWLRRHANRPRADSERTNGFVQRVDPAASLAHENDTTVVTTRDYPRKVTSRTMRNDVYRDALRAAESTLRNFARKK